MDDLGSVCCMCGDIGFSEKLFRCINCHHRIQHKYCSNYYGEFTQEIEQCDWCQSEEIKNSSSSHATVSSKSPAPAQFALISQKTTIPNTTVMTYHRLRRQRSLLQGLATAGTSCLRMSCVDGPNKAYVT